MVVLVVLVAAASSLPPFSLLIHLLEGWQGRGAPPPVAATFPQRALPVPRLAAKEEVHRDLPAPSDCAEPASAGAGRAARLLPLSDAPEKTEGWEKLEVAVAVAVAGTDPFPPPTMTTTRDQLESP